MDLPWFENPPGYQFLHCLVNSAKGGDSSAVDAFAVIKEKDFLIISQSKFRIKEVRSVHGESLTKAYSIATLML